MRSLCLFVLLSAAVLSDGFLLKADRPQVNLDPNNIVIVDHIHLAVTGVKGEMIVMFATSINVSSALVEYWTASNTSARLLSDVATLTQYNTNDSYTSPFIQSVTLKGLQAGTQYFYRCGDPSLVWSADFNFTTESSSFEDPFTFVAFGDHGTSINSTKVLNSMLREKSISNFKLILHAGDLSYANGNGTQWDIYHSIVMPLSTSTPWQVAVGNHEKEKKLNFIAYLTRYNWPYLQSGAQKKQLFYSFDYENAHFIALDSEQKAYYPNGTDLQYTWLQNDLMNVNRTVTPWVFAYFHTPLYCTNIDHSGEGVPLVAAYEDLFYKYGLDVAFTGHVHAYERTVGVYKGRPDPNGPVYITNGAGGTQEGLAQNWGPTQSWSAYHQSDNWGIGVVQVHNATHLYYQFKEAEQNQVMDSVWIVRKRGEAVASTVSDIDRPTTRPTESRYSAGITLVISLSVLLSVALLL